MRTPRLHGRGAASPSRALALTGAVTRRQRPAAAGRRPRPGDAGARLAGRPAHRRAGATTRTSAVRRLRPDHRRRALALDAVGGHEATVLTRSATRSPPTIDATSPATRRRPAVRTPARGQGGRVRRRPRATTRRPSAASTWSRELEARVADHGADRSAGSRTRQRVRRLRQHDRPGLRGRGARRRGRSARRGGHRLPARPAVHERLLPAQLHREPTRADQSCDDDAGARPDTDVTALAVLAAAQSQSPTTPTSTQPSTKATDWLVEQQSSRRLLRAARHHRGANANSTGLAGWALGESRRRSRRRSGPPRGCAASRSTTPTPCAPSCGADEGAIAYDAAALATGRADGITDADRGPVARGPRPRRCPVCGGRRTPARGPITPIDPSGFHRAGSKVTLGAARVRPGRRGLLLPAVTSSRRWPSWEPNGQALARATLPSGSHTRYYRSSNGRAAGHAAGVQGARRQEARRSRLKSRVERGGQAGRQGRRDSRRGEHYKVTFRGQARRRSAPPTTRAARSSGSASDRRPARSRSWCSGSSRTAGADQGLHRRPMSVARSASSPRPSWPRRRASPYRHPRRTPHRAPATRGHRRRRLQRPRRWRAAGAACPAAAGRRRVLAVPGRRVPAQLRLSGSRASSAGSRASRPATRA